MWICGKESSVTLLCCQLGLANEEKAGLRKQVNELIGRLKAIEESNKENSMALVDRINELSATVENYQKEMELMRKQLEAKDEVNMMLANEITNLRHQLENSRKHRLGRTSEQRRLLKTVTLTSLLWKNPSMTVLNSLLLIYTRDAYRSESFWN